MTTDLSKLDPSIFLYFAIGSLGPLVAASNVPPNTWDAVKLIAGCLLSGFTAVKGYTELSRGSQAKIATARAEGAASGGSDTTVVVTPVKSNAP